MIYRHILILSYLKQFYLLSCKFCISKKLHINVIYNFTQSNLIQ